MPPHSTSLSNWLELDPSPAHIPLVLPTNPKSNAVARPGSRQPTSLLSLVTAARYNPTARQLWEAYQASCQPDWAHLAEEAKTAALTPLLYDALRQSSPTTLPGAILSALQRDYFCTGKDNTLALYELSAVLPALTAAAIPVIVLKGAALAQAVYGNVALRPMLDIDLLVPHQAVPKACAALAGLGFSPVEPLPFADESGLFWNELVLRKPTGRGPVFLELHWHLLDNPYFAAQNLEFLWQRAVPAVVEGAAVRILAPDDLLLHLAGHNFFHHHGQHPWASPDVAYVVTKYGPTIDWDRLLTNAAELDMVQAVQTTLGRAAIDWYAPIPPAVLEKLQSLHPKRRERFFAYCQQNKYLKPFRTLIALPGWRLRLRYLQGLAAPSREYMAYRYQTRPDTPLMVAHLGRLLQLAFRPFSTRPPTPAPKPAGAGPTLSEKN